MRKPLSGLRQGRNNGKYDEINYDNLIKTTINLTKNKSKLKKMSQNCLKIDGLGPSRVADKIIKL